MKHSLIVHLLLASLVMAPARVFAENAGTAPSAPTQTSPPTTPAADPASGAAPAAGTAGLAQTQGAIQEGQSATQLAQALQGAEASKTKLLEGTKGCDAAVEAAKNACVESLSPFLQAAMTGLAAAMAMQQGAAGSSGQCQQAQQAQQPAQQNMQKYNADCGAKKTACEQKCSQAAQGADTVSTATCKADAEKNPTLKIKIMAECPKAAQANKAANEKGKAACGSLSQNQAAGMAGIGELLKGLMQSKQCQQDVATDCTKTPTAAGCPQALDCNKAENAANPRCICEKNPRAPGCGGQAESTPTTDPSRDPSTNNAANNSPLGGSTDGSPSSFGSDDAKSAAALPASPGGGGGGSAGKGGEAAEKGEKPKGIDTNVLGEGGGGGGGASATSNGSVPSDDPTGKYGKYLPEDPARKPTALADQVSGAAGLSNWEKVRKRYSENRPTLLRP